MIKTTKQLVLKLQQENNMLKQQIEVLKLQQENNMLKQQIEVLNKNNTLFYDLLPNEMYHVNLHLIIKNDQGNIIFPKDFNLIQKYIQLIQNSIFIILV